MAKPLTQLIKTLTDSTDEATKAGQATADGFTDDALAEISNQVDLPMDESIKLSKSPFDLGGSINDRLSVDGSHIDVVESKWSPTKFSIVEFFTDEAARGEGKGGRLLNEAVSKYGSELSGAFSSKESTVAAYNRGFRPTVEEYKNLSLEEIQKKVKEDGSVTMSYQGSKSLPMDEASRMARAEQQGFDVDTDWYHGTGDMTGLSEKGFDPKFLGSGADQWGTGYYLTNKPSTASGYAEGDNAGIIPAKVKITNPLHIDSTQARSIDDVLELDYDQVRMMLDDNQALKRSIDDEDMNPLGDHFDSFWETGPEDWMLDDLASRYTNPNHLSNDLFDGDEQGFLNALTKATGHDGVIVNFPESGEKFAIPFRPENIRSKFARFNPDKKGSSNLLAGVGGGALLIGITPEEAKAAPLEQQMLEAEALDQEGLTVDAEYSQVLNEISKAEDDAAWDNIAVTEETKEEATKEDESSGFLADVGEGIIEMPLQAIGGIADAVNETLDLTKELGGWLNENVVDLGGVVINEDGISLASGEEIAEADNIQIPTTDKADSITGGIIRGISQFVTGFVGAGKFKAMQALKPTTTSGKIGKAAIQGAMADFAAFDPHEERLANLVESSPALQNPVTEFLAASPDDNAAAGRLKNAVEGLGIGVAVDGLLTGLKVLRNARIAKKEVESAAKELKKAEAVESGFGSKQGEAFDPEIT
ncbi:MAG: hypothetical protein GY777_19045, partial [Candidatus Brocadiaceae bacterium]|nr:hypothetical protein [Candidatus Brocadiaceae bacterium]